MTAARGAEPGPTSVAMTHSSFSDMTYTDWYFVSFEVEYTESRLFLSEESPLSRSKSRATIDTLKTTTRARRAQPHPAGPSSQQPLGCGVPSLAVPPARPSSQHPLSIGVPSLAGFPWAPS